MKKVACFLLIFLAIIAIIAVAIIISPIVCVSYWHNRIRLRFYEERCSLQDHNF